MKPALLLCLLTCTLPAQAQTLGAGWSRLDGPAITAALEWQVLRYQDGSEQLFQIGGLTHYTTGWPNEGRWKVAQDLYCALWPPATGWTCYQVTRSPDATQLRFTDAAGHVWTGTFLDSPK